MTRVRRAFSIVASVVLCTSVFPTTPAWAQLATAELNGRVTDSSSAVLPGATVTATQTATGLVRTAVTDESGSYLISNLPTGPYRLEISLQGFRSYVRTGLVLTVGATPTINAVLELGSLEETVTVEGQAPLVDVRSAGVSAVIENERILELPLNGRNAVDLVLMVGAAVQTAEATNRTSPGGVRISVAGGLPTGVGYTLDGATHNNPQENVNLPLPFPDALQEFRVATSGLTAQNGVHSAAAVNAVTKSGTNRFSGNVFEFLRDHRFNATSPFAAIGPDGKRLDDGLRRNQFGGTLGGPVFKDKLFFFGAYQATVLRQRPASNIAYVPTAAMLAGDFSAFTSPQCNGGRQVPLRAPYVNNQIDPALFSKAALNLAKRLPSTTDPCGQITYDVKSDRDEKQTLARIDYQASAKHSFFGRYFIVRFTQPSGYAGGSDNVLKTSNQGANDWSHSLTLGATTVLSSSVVNSLRFAVNKATVDNYQTPFFSPKDIGSNVYSYDPGYMVMNVTGGFMLYPANQARAFFDNDTYQLGEDLTVVRGNHQFGVGANTQFWRGHYTSTSRANGSWIINGSATGLGLADLLVGRVTTLEHGGKNLLLINNWYVGMYAQDSWRLSNRVTVNYGMRWEPYFGQTVENSAVTIFRMENFQKGIKSTVFHNAPAGLTYPGDPGFPKGQTGLNKQWWNLSPRGGVAWDVRGDGRLAVRSSYSMGYDFMSGEYHNINAGAPPFGNRSIIQDPIGLFDDPYRGVGAGDPHPIVTGPDTPFVNFGSFGTMDPNINSPRVQSWNVTVEQQLGTQWGVSVAYLGSHSDRLWNAVALNPGVYMGLGPCVINGVSYPVCSTNANLNQRRLLYQQNPREALFIGALDLNTDIGYQNYSGLKLAATRRSAAGVSINANYTLSKCTGTPQNPRFNQSSAGYLDPNNPSFDDGYCDQDHRHLATMTVGYETPAMGNAALRAVASHWRLSGILNARSGNRLEILSGIDNAFTGIGNQRPNQVSDDFYAHSLASYFNRAAFAQPAPGTLGNLPRNAVTGPNFWNVDLAVSKLVAVTGTQRLELRLESFNLLNHFNWGDPIATNLNFNAGTFGRITTLPVGASMRVMQFGIKYDF
jgi:hypothetical protein